MRLKYTGSTYLLAHMGFPHRYAGEKSCRSHDPALSCDSRYHLVTFSLDTESGYPQLPYRLHSLPLTCMRSSIEVAPITALIF